MNKIKSRNGYEIIIDDNISSFLKSDYISYRKSIDEFFYRDCIYLKRFIVDFNNKFIPKYHHIIFKNGNKNDFRIDNLICVTKKPRVYSTKGDKDTFNPYMLKKIRRPTSSKYKGVSKRKDTGKYKAYITINRKLIHLGQFNSEKDAAIAYNAALDSYGINGIKNIIKQKTL